MLRRFLQEKDEFVEQILKDVAAMGVKYEKLSYTSDFFPQLSDCTERLIKLGHLYADDTPVEQMRQVRSPAQHSVISCGLRITWTLPNHRRLCHCAVIHAKLHA